MVISPKKLIIEETAKKWDIFFKTRVKYQFNGG